MSPRSSGALEPMTEARVVYFEKEARARDLNAVDPIRPSFERAKDGRIGSTALRLTSSRPSFSKYTTRASVIGSRAPEKMLRERRAPRATPPLLAGVAGQKRDDAIGLAQRVGAEDEGFRGVEAHAAIMMSASVPDRA